jgi:hypothetical protein
VQGERVSQESALSRCLNLLDRSISVWLMMNRVYGNQGNRFLRRRISDLNDFKLLIDVPS